MGTSFKQRTVKRGLDVSLACTGLVLASPLLLVISVLELKIHGWPPLFRQPRPGRHGKIFHILKFRSMTNDRDKEGQLLPDVDRLTAFGKFLRASSVDEIPELWNVLAGQMSLVGPRPLLVEYLPLYSKEQARRHELRPGITGWAQINGRNAVSWEEKFALDLWYIDNQSLLLDLQIIFRTMAKVMKREGISATGEATMSKFTGTEPPPA